MCECVYVGECLCVCVYLCVCTIVARIKTNEWSLFLVGCHGNHQDSSETGETQVRLR